MNQQLLQSWLALQCQAMPGAVSACASIRTDSVVPEKVIANWPADGEADPELSKLLEMAEHSDGAVTSTQRKSAGSNPRLLRIAHPLDARGEKLGAVAVTLNEIPESQHRSVIRLIEWGNTWLDLLRQQSGSVGEEEAALAGTLQCVLKAENLQHAAIALTGYLANRYGLERVALGIRKQRGYRLLALSDSVQIPARSELARQLSAAMDEAERHQGLLLWPGAQAAPAHQALALAEQDTRILTLVLNSEQGEFAALTFESQNSALQTPAVHHQLTVLAIHLGPLLALKQASGRVILPQRHPENRSHPLAAHLKRLALFLLITLALLYLAAADVYRISGPAELEGALHRAITAPFDGYVIAANARAGETVESGAVLAKMDDRDLRLELRQLQSEKNELDKQYRQALARLEHAQAQILEAQLAQADARIDLLVHQIERVSLRAPFDGLVIAGDLSRSLGRPVERGEVLLEVAPLTGYRVAVEIPGRDIPMIKTGAQGTLLLAARPGEALKFKVANTTRMPGSTPRAGYFRVEAQLLGDGEGLRPGLRGVAKIEAGEQSRFWIWTHEIADWLRYRLWAWLP